MLADSTALTVMEAMLTMMPWSRSSMPGRMVSTIFRLDIRFTFMILLGRPAGSCAKLPTAGGPMPAQLTKAAQWV